MKSRIKKYIPGEKWHILADSWNRHIQGVREAQFTLGNGFIGSRGILEEIPYDAHPGTYIAGVYDHMGSKVSDLVNLPNPISFKISLDGEKLDLSTTPNLRHRRYLNMKKALLTRHTVYETAGSNKIDYQSVRFFSMLDKNIAVMRVFITPLDKVCTLTVSSDIDTAVSNVSGVSEGRKTHFKIKEVVTSEEKIISYVNVQTLTTKTDVSYAHALNISVGNKNWFAKEEDLILKLKKNQTAIFTKICSMFSKEPSEDFDIKDETIRNLQHAISLGFEKLIKRHCNSWNRLWRSADIKMKGDLENQRNLRFAIYHLLIAGIDNDGKSSIGAKTLSGEGYRGHIFWDSEIFILPFFIFTNPQVAKSLLLYRMKRLDQAKEIAHTRGYLGAMFPWESADSGYEETPPWARNLDGSIIRIYTHEMEFHITADIAYSAYKYYVATEDEDFMLKYGYELFFETARFWSSITKFNKDKNRFEIHNVIGPDEFHENVNNNAYTNMLARWNIFIAYAMYMKMKKLHSKDYFHLIKKIGLKKKEIERWKNIIAKMYINIRKDKVIEQFEGFFRKKKVKITELDENFMPLMPRSLKLKDIGKYAIAKQSDVIMLLYLFSDAFDMKTKRKNYDFYAPITVHKSSLSPSIHAIMSSEIGYINKSYRYFLMALNADISDLHRNTNEGIHAANAAGVWQIVTHGFAGMRVVKETLSFNPKLPKEIAYISFRAHWKQFILKITCEGKRLKLRCISKRGKKIYLRLKVFGRLYNIYPGKTYIFKSGKKGA